MSEGLQGLAVVVVSYGSHDLLERNLAAVAASVPEAVVVVVDSFSSPEERSAVRELCNRRGWHAVLADTNTGFGGGVNLGVARARQLGCHTFLVLNPDARIERRSVQRLAARALEEPLALVAPVILDERGRTWSEGTYLYLSDGRMGSPRKHLARAGTPHLYWASGACFVVGAVLWDLLGGFDEQYFLYWEDVDLCLRVVKAGGTVVVDPTAVAVHEEGGTQVRTDLRAKSEVYYYYNIRNRLLFAARHLDARGVRRWRRSSFGAARRILLRGGRRQFLTPIPPLRAAILGTWAGLRLSQPPPGRSSRP